MSRITVRNQGQVEDSGKVNWRGDQVSTPQGGQSIYDTSAIKLADLGSRKVVGDRVFRYAKAGAALAAGDLLETKAVTLNSVTAGLASPAGGKVFAFYAATAVTADFFAEGNLISQSGTAANMGHYYRIKSNPVNAAGTSDMNVELYDRLEKIANVTDEWTITQNAYANVQQQTAAAGVSVGFAPVAVSSGDYCWLQTWGPASVKGGAVAAGLALIPGATGAVSAPVATTGIPIGFTMSIITASQRGVAFVQIAP